MPLSTNPNHLLFEIFHNYYYFCHIIAHFGKIFFTRPYIIKQRWSFLSPSINQSVYMLMPKQRGLQHRNLVQRYWRGFWEDLKAIFLKTNLRCFRMIFKNIFLDFSINYSFNLQFFIFLHVIQVILKRNFENILKRFFLQKSF